MAVSKPPSKKIAPTTASKESHNKVSLFLAEFFSSFLLIKINLSNFISLAHRAKFVAETRPIVEKYGLVMEDCDCEVGEIDIQNDTTISAEKLDEFFADFQRLIDIIRANNLKLVAYSDRLIPSGTNEDDKGPAIVLSIDENGKLNREFIGV